MWGECEKRECVEWEGIATPALGATPRGGGGLGGGPPLLSPPLPAPAPLFHPSFPPNTFTGRAKKKHPTHGGATAAKKA
jgi:hypothetical protein